MEKVILNETPRRTSKSFGINNIKLDDFELPDVKQFTNFKISSDISVREDVNDFKPKFRIGDSLVNQLNIEANKEIYINVDKQLVSPIIVDFELDDEQNVLVDNVVICVEDGIDATVILKYKTNNEATKAFHNGACTVKAKANSNVKVIILNLLNQNSENYYSMNNKVEENASLEYIIADFGGCKTVTNYYSNLVGNTSNNVVNTMYLGIDNQLLDLNYILSNFFFYFQIFL